MAEAGAYLGPILAHGKPPAGRELFNGERRGGAERMSCLTLPPVEYECAEGDDEHRLERLIQEKKRRATLKKTRFLLFSQFIISSGMERIL